MTRGSILVADPGCERDEFDLFNGAGALTISDRSTASEIFWARDSMNSAGSTPGGKNLSGSL